MDEEAIFTMALALKSPDRRAAYLDQACAGQADLRRKVEQLLSAHLRGGNFLDAAAAAWNAQLPLSVPTAIEGSGTLIGPYKLLEQIGEGGMGLVFVAEQQQPVKRRVALKLIKPGMDSRQVVARFEAERQALALMDHPHIAKVFDGGTTDSGRPYFVMELIKGVPITDYSDHNQVPIHERLELFVDVCQAVQHAHQKGIIHRDLKPSNVLVVSHDGTPVVKVIDFGVAKAIGQQLTDKTIYTQFSQLIGTPLYMSPEQVGQSGLDVDTRSDIYSLGVLLYELLTGTTPFDKERMREMGYDEMRRIIREDEPPKPSTRISTLGKAATTVSTHRQSDPQQLRRLFRGELDWIVMKSLEKDRNRRYYSANGFAMDVQRYLHDEAVLACPPSPWYRFRKFARRNKVVLLAATVIVATLLVAGATVTWKWWEAEHAQEQEREAKGKVEEALDEAQKAEQRAKLGEAEALVGQAHGTRLSRRPGQRFESLEALRQAAAIGRELGQPPEWFDRLRNEAIAALALPDVHITREFGSFPSGTLRAELKDDFTLYARTTETVGCTIRRVVDDTEVCRLPELGEPALARFGSGGMLALLGISSERFQLWDVSGTQAALRFEEQKVVTWQFRLNGDLLGLSHVDGSMSIYQTSTWSLLHRLAPAEIVRRLDLCLHPTAPFVAAFSYFHRVVQVRDLGSDTVVASVLPPWPDGNGLCAWSPDGRTLLVPQGDGGKIQEYAFDPAATPALRPTRLLQGPIERSGNNIAFHPAGDRFVARGWEGLIDLYDAVSGQPLFSTQWLMSASDVKVNFDRTGEWLAGARVGPGYERIGLWSFAGGQEYRYLVHADDVKFANHRNDPTVHPGGQLAAIGLPDGVAFFDLDTGRELAHIPSGNVCTQFDGAGNLLTNGFEGFFRWPIRPDLAQPRRLLVGPPQRLPFHPGTRAIAASHDGRVIAKCIWNGYGEQDFAGGWILHPDFSAPRWVETGLSLGSCSVSPDGRWVAFGGPHLAAGLPAIHVYETAKAQRYWQSPVNEGEWCRFSPDGRWLATNTDGGRLYAVGTWEPGPQLGPGNPWDMTSELAILGQSNGIYRLVELATGRELARLEDPERNNGAAAFTPDGTKLAVAAKNGLRVWDLRRIHAELAKLRLDWNAPPLPSPSAPPATPLSIHLELGDLPQRAQADTLVQEAAQHISAKEHAKALAELRQAVQIAPSCAAAQNNLARLLLTGPKELRDPKQALPLARKAVELEPEQSNYINTLGLALYYTDHFADAIPVLERSLREQAGKSDACDLLFLAMCHHCLGEAARAKDCLERGKQWFQNNKTRLRAESIEELTAFQAEADAVLAQPPGQGNK